MRKLVIFLFIVCMGVGSLSVQPTRTYFINTPDSLNPLLIAANRADFIDFLESKMRTEVTNRSGSKSEMTEFTSDYICVQVMSRSSWQMRLLTVNDSTRFICTVSTVCAPACNSHINFYTTDWKKSPSTSYLPLVPDIGNFIVPASDTADIYRYQDALLQADTPSVRAGLSSKDATLTFTFATLDYMEKEAAEKLKPLLRHPVSYIWKEGKFALVE